MSVLLFLIPVVFLVEPILGLILGIIVAPLPLYAKLLIIWFILSALNKDAEPSDQT